jgi:hypothetical protein
MRSPEGGGNGVHDSNVSTTSSTSPRICSPEGGSNGVDADGTLMEPLPSHSASQMRTDALQAVGSWSVGIFARPERAGVNGAAAASNIKAEFES